MWNERLQTHFRVSGTQLISVDASGNVTELGTITGSGTVSLPYSFNTQAVIADGKYYLYDSTDGLRQINDPDVGSPIDCAWIDQYYFFTDGENLYHTEISSESSIDPTDFATSEFSPDPTLGVLKTPDDKMAVFNRYSTEYFVNDASEAFSFSRLNSRTVKAGIVGTHCKCEMMGAVFIMGGAKEENVSVHILGVGSAVKVATREIDKIIAEYTEEELSTSVIEARVEDGYHLLIVHLPDETLIYNHTIAQSFGTQTAWSTLRSGTKLTDNYRAKYGVWDPRLSKWIYGDKKEAILGLLDDSVATHYGDIAEWELYTPFYYLESASIDEIEIETVSGFTSTKDATVGMSITYDGITYGRERFMQYGAPGKYNNRFIAYRLGYVNDWLSIKLRGHRDQEWHFLGGLLSMANLATRTNRLALSAIDLKQLTGWPDAVIEDYINILRDYIRLANAVDENIEVDVDLMVEIGLGQNQAIASLTRAIDSALKQQIVPTYKSQDQENPVMPISSSIP